MLIDKNKKCNLEKYLSSHINNHLNNFDYNEIFMADESKDDVIKDDAKYEINETKSIEEEPIKKR